jgi:hypothetical protein
MFLCRYLIIEGSNWIFSILSNLGVMEARTAGTDSTEGGPHIGDAAILRSAVPCKRLIRTLAKGVKVVPCEVARI